MDAGVNLPGNFHDSKSTLWCNIYDHIMALPDGYVVVCDSAFNTGGRLKGKLVKLAERKADDNSEKSGYEKSLTHLRQCSEWGNQVLTGAFRCMRTKLPTDNIKRPEFNGVIFFSIIGGQRHVAAIKSRHTLMNC